MPKILIRYKSSSEIPKGFEDMYRPVDDAKPDGPQIWDGFEPDPDGYAVTQAGKTQAELARLRKAQERQQAALDRYKKKDQDDLWTPEEIEQAVQAAAQLAEIQGKQVDVADLRKQIAADIGAQFQQKERAIQAQLESTGKRASHFEEAYKQVILRNTATAALAKLPRPKKGLEEIAVDRFARELELEAIDQDGGFPQYVPRVRGPNGHRIDANGEPIPPDRYAESEFGRAFAELFEPAERRNGTGTGTGDQAGRQTGTTGRQGSGRYQIRQSETLSDTGRYRDLIKSTPDSDFVQVLDDQGKVIATRPGEKK